MHDPTAYLFGGVAGNAGLFSTVADLETYMRIHLSGGMGPSGRVYKKETVDLFSRRVDGLNYTNRRALGWDTVPIQENPPCGKRASLNSFGHTGYTGTSMWVDRDRQTGIILLTNRVHPSDQSKMILQARTQISDAVWEQVQIQT